MPSDLDADKLKKMQDLLAQLQTAAQELSLQANSMCKDAKPEWDRRTQDLLEEWRAWRTRIPGLATPPSLSELDLGPAEEPDITPLLRAWSDIPRPSGIWGDAWGCDISPAEVALLLDKPQGQIETKDFSGYIGYHTTLNPDDLRDRVYLLPALLGCWARAQGNQEEQWFLEHFHAEMAQTQLVQKALNDAQRSAAQTFARRQLLARLSRETSLCIVGNAGAGRWTSTVLAYGAWSGDLPAFWQEWWHSPNPGHARALIQFASSLICLDNRNPVFAPWTPSGGGGPCLPWDHDSIGSDEQWPEDAVAFIRQVLTPEHVACGLDHAAGILPAEETAGTIAFLQAELDLHPARTADRCAILATMAETPSGAMSMSWADWGCE